MLKENRKSKTFLVGFLFSFIFLFLFSLNFVSAAVPFQTTMDNGLQISYPKIESIKVNQDFNLSVHVYNISDGKKVVYPEANCSFEIYGDDGVHLIDGENLFPSDGEFSYYISSGNFSSIGMYTFNIYCSSNSEGGFVDGAFQVTPTGKLEVSSFLWIFLAIIGLTFLLGVVFENNWFVFFGFIELLFFGFFIMINGIDIFKDVTTTRAISFIVWGISIIGIFKSAQGMLEEGFGR